MLNGAKNLDGVNINGIEKLNVFIITFFLEFKKLILRPKSLLTLV